MPTTILKDKWQRLYFKAELIADPFASRRRKRSFAFVLNAASAIKDLLTGPAAGYLEFIARIVSRMMKSPAAKYIIPSQLKGNEGGRGQNEN
jgi:hypothetical protein